MLERFEPVKHVVFNESAQSELVTVVVITYNHEQYIEECLDGILAQECDFPMKLLVCDHSSSDRTVELCIERLSSASVPSELFVAPRSFMKRVNGRATGKANFMEMCRRAEGEYIACCSGDDVWTSSSKLQLQVEFLNNNQDVSIVWTNTTNGPNIVAAVPKVFDNQSIVLEDYRYFNPNGWAASTVMFRKNSVDFQTWASEFSSAPYEDWTLHMLCLKNGRGHRLSEVTTLYRLHEQGMFAQIKQNRFMHLMELMQTINYNQDYFASLDYSDYPEIRDRWIEDYEMGVIYRRFEDYLEKLGFVKSVGFVIRRLLKFVSRRILGN